MSTAKKKLKFDVEWINISQVVPLPYNPRKWSDAKYKQLSASIDQFGLVEPFVMNKRNNHMVGGNQRFKVVVAKGYSEIPVVWVDLDDIAEKALSTVLNEIDFGFDQEKKDALLKEISESKNTTELMRMALDLKAKMEDLENSQPQNAEMQFSPVIHKKMDYVMILFDNETDFINFTDEMGLKNVYDVNKGKSIGVGRVIKYEDYLTRKKK